MLRTMTTLLTDPTASTLIVLDQVERATLTEIARATGKPLSTIQRAVDGLLTVHILERKSPRGPVGFAADAPRRALRELAEWRLGIEIASVIAGSALSGVGSTWSTAIPSTIHDTKIRQAWPRALRSIVTQYRPAKVILFGSQARGDARPDSDVDLLVVFDDDLDRRDRRIGIRRLLHDMPFAKDVLVASTAGIQNAAAGTAVAAAARDGVVVYER